MAAGREARVGWWWPHPEVHLEWNLEVQPHPQLQGSFEGAHLEAANHRRVVSGQPVGHWRQPANHWRVVSLWVTGGSQSQEVCQPVGHWKQPANHRRVVACGSLEAANHRRVVACGSLEAANHGRDHRNTILKWTQYIILYRSYLTLVEMYENYTRRYTWRVHT
jgi:hypothetical protein